MTPHPLARAGRIARLATLFLAISFASARAYGDPPPDPPFLYIGQTVVGRSECDTCAPRVCAGQPALVTIRGVLPNHCYTLRSFRLAPNRGLYTMVVADFVVDTCATGCGIDPYSYQASVELPPLPAGTYQFMIREQARRCPDTTVVSTNLGRVDTYSVLPDCGSPPPLSPDSLVRTFVRLAISPEHPCAGDSVTLKLLTNGCPPCVHLVSFGAVDADTGSFAGVIEWTPQCLNLRCAPESLATSMGRLAQGSFHVIAPMTVHVLGTSNPDSTITFVLPFEFQVGPPGCVGTPPPCVAREMFSSVPAHQCAVTLDPGKSGVVPLFYESQLEMGGLEGTLEVPAPFMITDLRVAPGLAGVHLTFNNEIHRAHWLVFTDPGVTLPPGARQHLFDATLLASSDAWSGASVLMFSRITVAASPSGDGLPLCDRMTLGFEVIATRLCIAGDSSTCDVNHDGRLDVRDLVRMVGCLRQNGGDTTGTSPCVDCNGSGAFDFSDIFCCASAILRGPGVPRDSVHADDSLQISIGPVYSLGADRIVHVKVSGARALGAMSLRFDFPADRWIATQRVYPALASRPVDVDWSPFLDDRDPGHLYFGALRLGESGGEDSFGFEILMHSTAAPLPGDRLDAVSAEFGGTDGSVIVPSAALPTLSLTAPAPPEPGPGPPVQTLALSPPRPNPFGASTSFVVSLPKSAQVDLAVHDLAGRRVATLAHAAYGPGEHSFTWGGAGARDGLYFVRLTVDGEVLSTRVALLRNTRP